MLVFKGWILNATSSYWLCYKVRCLRVENFTLPICDMKSPISSESIEDIDFGQQGAQILGELDWKTSCSKNDKNEKSQK